MLLDVMPEAFGMEVEEEKRKTSPHRPRTRKNVNDTFAELGPYYVRRAYRMHADSFWALHRLLKVGIVSAKPFRTKTHKDGAKNGLIPSTVRLSAALRCFAGGRPEDISLVHGMSHSEVFNSVWKAVDAVNDCCTLDIQYPSSHEVQRNVAQALQSKSEANFPMLCGSCLDGIPVWCEKPTATMCKIAQCGPKKFMCGWKKKFGVNLQPRCCGFGGKIP